MRVYYGTTISGVYREILEDLLNDSDFIASPRGMEVKEIRDCSMEIKFPTMNLYKNKYRSSPEKYIAAELLWYFAGTNNPEFIEHYASMWKNIHNADGTVNSSYGNLLFTEKNEHGFTQYQWAIESLKRDKDTRQAFMHFNKPEHQFFENKDQVCTMQAIFHIRDNQLFMTITMRSNDVILGFMTDWAFFSTLHYHVYNQLLPYYKDLKMGSYTHISHSMHLYERHYELVRNMTEEDCMFLDDNIPLLNKTILNENGSIKEEYKEFLEPIQRGVKPDYNKKTGNTLLDWCFEKLR